jgi:hypothetical protein
MKSMLKTMKVGMKKETNGESNPFVSAGLTCYLRSFLLFRNFFVCAY